MNDRAAGQAMHRLRVVSARAGLFPLNRRLFKTSSKPERVKSPQCRQTLPDTMKAEPRFFLLVRFQEALFTQVQPSRFRSAELRRHRFVSVRVGLFPPNRRLFKPKIKRLRGHVAQR